MGKAFHCRTSTIVKEMAQPAALTVDQEWDTTVAPLSDELWERVFFYTLPYNPSFSLQESPTVLSRVCRTWRRIAISYPLLWNSISLSSSQDNMTQGTVQLVKTWLERSNSYPLHVDLRLPFDVLPWSISTNDEEFETINAILSLLYDHASRLRTLLRGFPRILQDVLQSEDLPLVELFLVDPPEGDLRSFPLTALPASLKSFSVYNSYVHLTPATRWPKLEHIEIWQTDAGLAGMSPGDCLYILSQLPSLRSGSFHISVDDDDDESRKTFPTRVVLPDLRCLVLSTFPEHNIGTVLRALSTPALEAIGIDGCASRTLSDNLPEFLVQCTRTVRLVVLGQIGMMSLTLLAALSGAPATSRIAMCSSSFDGHVAARIGRARCTERGVEYADRWTNVGSPGHLLSLAYTSKEMWSDMEGPQEALYRFPEWTFQDVHRWRPAEVRPDGERLDDVFEGSVKVSICKGQNASHTCFSDSWVS